MEANGLAERYCRGLCTNRWQQQLGSRVIASSLTCWEDGGGSVGMSLRCGSLDDGRGGRGGRGGKSMETSRMSSVSPEAAREGPLTLRSLAATRRPRVMERCSQRGALSKTAAARKIPRDMIRLSPRSIVAAIEGCRSKHHR